MDGLSLSFFLIAAFFGELTGLGGIAVTIWCQLRGGPKAAQCAIFQPVMLATFVTSAVTPIIAGAATATTMKLYLFALPALVLAIWRGIQLYGKLHDAAFHKVVLVCCRRPVFH